MAILNPETTVTTKDILQVAKQLGTPTYLYDETMIQRKINQLRDMPNAFGMNIRYAMKANSTKAILQIMDAYGLDIDASSMNEVRRAAISEIKYPNIMLTTQEVPIGIDRPNLEFMMTCGLRYNVCSLRQLELISNFAEKNNIPLSLRVHPGVGSGESKTRDTGSPYSCFGIHLSDLEQALSIVKEKNLLIDQVHTHIGSGGDPEKWKANIDRVLGFTEKYFPQAEIVSLGGGIKEARMPNEKAADIQKLGEYAKARFEDFANKTGRKLKMEIEPGTYLLANSGFIVTQVIDKKSTGKEGFDFLVLDGGMELNTRPLLYGSQHPFYVVSKDGTLLSSEFDSLGLENKMLVPVGRCCESGDSQSLDNEGNIIPRKMAAPEIGDYFVIGGAGAYCSSMSPFNYNSHLQSPEVLLRLNGDLKLIRSRQNLTQIVANEIAL